MTTQSPSWHAMLEQLAIAVALQKLLQTHDERLSWSVVMMGITQRALDFDQSSHTLQEGQ